MFYKISTNIYFLFVLIISMVGSDYYRTKEMLFARTIISIIVIFFFRLGINKKLIYVLISWFLFFSICSIVSGNIEQGTLLKFTSMFLESYALLHIFKYKFPDIYVKWILVLSLISLIGWFLSIINIELLTSILKPFNLSGGHIGDDPNGIYLHTIFYTLNYSTSHAWNLLLPRNAGFCWEPGGFSLLIVLAIYINLILRKENIISWKNILLLSTLITTFSTTGYLVLFGVLIYEYAAKKKNLITIIILPLIIILFYNLFYRFEFLSGKVGVYTEIDPYLIPTVGGYTLAGSRIAGYSLVLQDLKRNLFLGKALRTTGYYSGYGDFNVWHLNSIYTITSTMGLVGLLLWLWFLVNSSKELSKTYTHTPKYGLLVYIILASFGFNIHVFSIIFTFATYGYFLSRNNNAIKSN